jgi:hypothetical protein
LSGVIRKNIGQAAFQARHDLMQSPQRNTLLTLFQTVESRCRHGELSRELGESLITTGPTQELGKLFIE